MRIDRNAMRNLETQTSETLLKYAKEIDLLIASNRWLMKKGVDKRLRREANKQMRQRQTEVFEVLLTRQEKETDQLIEILDQCQIKLSSSL